MVHAPKYDCSKLERHAQAEAELPPGGGAGDRHEVLVADPRRPVFSEPSALRRRLAELALGLPQIGVLVKLVDSARNSALTFSLILKFL